MAGLLGISAYYHDSAAALVVDGQIVAAAQEERFSRQKFDARFPAAAVRYCLREAGGRAADLEAIVFYDKPIAKFDRLLETHLALAPNGGRAFVVAMQSFLKEKLHLKRTLRRALADAAACRVDELPPLLFAGHHQAHAASAFYPSPFERAAVLCVDGVGEWATTSLWLGEGARLTPCWELRFPHSLGLLYAAFTQFCGFRVNADEYKLMGLAPYGRPLHSPTILARLIDLKDDGSFRLNLDYFDFAAGLSMVNERFAALFGGPPRALGAAITQREKDLAASIQAVTEEVMLRLAATARRELAVDALCLAGGVALNCVANGRLRREGAFRDIWVQPAAGDAGGAVGAALAAWHQHFDRPRALTGRDGMRGGLLGPTYDATAIASALDELGACYERCEEADLIERVAPALAAGKTVGWFDGRMEFGPRALGARSILADPRDASMRQRLNDDIKRREGFRPFAPIVVEERATDYFEIAGPSPYMSFAAPVRLAAQPVLAAVTHVDGSARLQTLARTAQPRLYRLLERFAALSGVPALVNTSFNGPDEPIVNSPVDAYRCFVRLGLDCLVVGDCLLERDRQPAAAPASAPEPVPQTSWRRRLVARMAQIQVTLLLGLVYFFMIVPAGLIFRMFGRNPLELGFTPGLTSYRSISRSPTPMDQPF